MKTPPVWAFRIRGGKNMRLQFSYCRARVCGEHISLCCLLAPDVYVCIIDLHSNLCVPFSIVASCIRVCMCARAVFGPSLSRHCHLRCLGGCVCGDSHASLRRASTRMASACRLRCGVLVWRCCAPYLPNRRAGEQVAIRCARWPIVSGRMSVRNRWCGAPVRGWCGFLGAQRCLCMQFGSLSFDAKSG